MAKKRSKRERRPNRRAKRILERARLEAQVILAEARAESTEARIIALTEAQAEAAHIRGEADRAALHTVEQAHADAGWILTQTRQFAQAESRSLTTEAELGAERLRASAAVAAEQMRRDALVEREQALRDAATERARMRDEALLDAARLRDDARTEAAEFLARLDAEREAILDAARERAQVIDARSNDERADREILAFLDAEAADTTEVAAAPPPALVFRPALVTDGRPHPDVVAAPAPVEPVADLEPVAIFEPSSSAAEPTRTPLIWSSEEAPEPAAATRTLEQWTEAEGESEFWEQNPPEPTRRGRRWRRSGAGRA